MSQYQYYEFLAIDRPLTREEQDAVGAFSTRARITTTSFSNEYHWGDFRGDPNRLMQRYYDAHLYVSNWGTHRLMLRLPIALLDPETAEDYCVDDQAHASVSGRFLVLDFTSTEEEGYFGFEEDAPGTLSSLIGVRAELAAGDLRPLYIAWLAGGCSTWNLDSEAYGDGIEPPLPPGLGQLTAGQQALADFLRVDKDLLAIAAEDSPRIAATAKDPAVLAEWVSRLPEAQKNDYLVRLMQGESNIVSAELQRRHRDSSATATPVPERRSVAAMFAEADRRQKESARRVALEIAEAAELRALAQTQAREKRLDALALEGDLAWSRVDELIATRKPTEYDAALTLLTDLGGLAEREDRIGQFTARTSALRHAHARKISLMERFDKAGF